MGIMATLPHISLSFLLCPKIEIQFYLSLTIEYAKSSLVDLFPLSTINFYFGLHDFGRICDPLNGSIPHRVYWK